MNSSPENDWSVVREEARELVIAAANSGLVLRLVGSGGIRCYLPEMARLMDDLRPTPKDLDFVCRKQDRNALKEIFEARGYENDRNMMVAMEGLRYLFTHVQSGLKVDVFVDRLDFCHRIELAGVLERHPMSIPIEPLLLHKLQIVELTEGDLLDIGIMLATVGPGDGTTGDDHAFSMQELLAPLTADWGFWRTVTGNLERVQARAEGGGYSMIKQADAGTLIARRAAAVRAAAMDVPKTIRWKVRARVGERLQWWQDVDEREGTY